MDEPNYFFGFDFILDNEVISKWCFNWKSEPSTLASSRFHVFSIGSDPFSRNEFEEILESKKGMLLMDNDEWKFQPLVELPSLAPVPIAWLLSRFAFGL